MPVFKLTTQVVMTSTAIVELAMMTLVIQYALAQMMSMEKTAKF